MMNLIAWVMFFATMFAIFIELYAWAAFIAFSLLVILLREINSNLCELLAELKNKNIQLDSGKKDF
jgi:hypothetical protein